VVRGEGCVCVSANGQRQDARLCHTPLAGVCSKVSKTSALLVLYLCFTADVAGEDDEETAGYRCCAHARPRFTGVCVVKQ
jgi:hypothetical protein